MQNNPLPRFAEIDNTDTKISSEDKKQNSKKDKQRKLFNSKRAPPITKYLFKHIN